MLKILRQKVSSMTMALQPYAKRSNFVPVKRAKGVGDKKQYIDLVFWKNRRLVQVAYIPSMNAIVFVDVEINVDDIEYRVMVNDSIDAWARIDKAIEKRKRPDPNDVELAYAVYEVPSQEMMNTYMRALSEIQPAGESKDVSGLTDYVSEDKAEQKLVVGQIDNVAIVIKVTKVLRNYEDRFGSHKAGKVSASISALVVDELISTDVEPDVGVDDAPKVEAIESNRKSKVS
jgi:hypothetical protein